MINGRYEPVGTIGPVIKIRGKIDHFRAFFFVFTCFLPPPPPLLLHLSSFPPLSPFLLWFTSRSEEAVAFSLYLSLSLTTPVNTESSAAASSSRRSPRSIAPAPPGARGGVCVCLFLLCPRRRYPAILAPSRVSGDSASGAAPSRFCQICLDDLGATFKPWHQGQPEIESGVL
ncbi:hypothetical protein NL676_028759 [Syzygium grande]|nr:hypothetical protein NL676_028759 [Syzygium grande]